MKSILIILAMAVWGIVHSLFASIAFKSHVQKIFGKEIVHGYRLFYNAFSLISFLPILYLVGTMPSVSLYSVPAPWRYFMFAGQIVAGICLLITFLQTDALSFIGIKQLISSEEKSGLVTNGFYRVVRHPLYTFSLLFLWLTPSMSLNTFVFYIGITLYFIIGAYFEEKKLIHEFGQAYVDYKNRTPMLIPNPFIKE